MAMPAKNRASLLLAPRSPQLYFGGPASALSRTNGIIFPIQPDIAYQQQVNYSNYDLAHTNYTMYAYRNTSSPSIQVTAQFANTTQLEIDYNLGVLHFLRGVTKMYFGIGDTRAGEPYAGTPPPVLRFSAFGENVFNNVRVVVGSFATTFDSGVDLKTTSGGDSLPAVMTVSIDLMPQVSPDRQKNNFSKRRFLSGSAYTEGFI